MKHIKVILIIAYLLFSCKRIQSENNWHHKYKEGDIVYLKPDSIKAVIYRTYDGFEIDRYAISYTDSLKVRHDTWVMESEIY